MKKLICLSLILVIGFSATAQIQKDHSMTVLVDGKEFKSLPQQIKIGGYRYITANSAKPDQSLRIWIGGWDGGVIIEPGSYLIVNGDNPDTKENFKKAEDLGKYRGIAAIKYVLETKSPRMEYHVGYSGNNDETLDVKLGEDGYLEFTFKCSLFGTWWKEKTSATVFGGLGRLKDKMTDKAVTNATGLDQDIDPEGNGYKKQKETDKIELTSGVVKLKLKKE